MGTPNPVAQLIWGDNFDCSGEAMPWHAQTRPIFVVHRCMVCVCHLPLSVAWSPTPLQSWSQKEPFSGTFSPMNALWRRQFDIDENETNCVNYKIFSSWCTRSFKFVHRLGESAADQLRGHLEQGISDGHTQPCRAADLGWQLRLQWRSHALACTN